MIKRSRLYFITLLYLEVLKTLVITITVRFNAALIVNRDLIVT